MTKYLLTSWSGTKSIGSSFTSVNTLTKDRKLISRLHYRSVFIIITLIFLSSGTLNAQDESTLRFKNPDRRKFTMPFRLVSNLIIIPVIINNSDTLNFILDTGLKTSLITNLPKEDSTLLKFTSSTIIKGLGEEENLEVLFSPKNSIKIGKIYSNNFKFMYIQGNRFNLTGDLGMEVHGIIGSDVFKSFIIKIAYISQTLTFYNPKKFNAQRKLRNYEVLPLQFYREKPYITVPVVTTRGDSLNTKLLIDNGSGDAIWLFMNTNPNITIPQNNRYTYLGKGLNGDIHGHLGRIKKISVGKYTLNKVTCAFPDTISLQNAIKQDIPGRNGSIGAELLRRFTVYIDYTNSKIAFRKNRHFKDHFRFNTAGLTAKAPFGLLPYYTVSYIRAESPADKAGIKTGDQIISLNGKKASKLSITDINGTMREQEGKTIRITVTRNNKEFSFKFKLKEDI